MVCASGKFLLWANELLCPCSVMECLIKIAQLCSSSKCLPSLSFLPSFFTFLSYPSFYLSIFLYSVCGVWVWDVSKSDPVGEEDSCAAGIRAQPLKLGRLVSRQTSHAEHPQRYDMETPIHVEVKTLISEGQKNLEVTSVISNGK